MKGKSNISDELVASFLDGMTDVAGTMTVLHAAKNDAELRDYLDFARSLDAPSLAGTGDLPLRYMAADDGEDCGCVLKCELYILRHQKITASYEELLELAGEKGWLLSAGTPLHNMGRTLESKGLSVARHYYASADDLKEALSDGMDVMLAIDEGEISGDFNEEAMEDIEIGEIPDHAVVLMMIDDDSGEVMLYDPAQGEIPVSVSMERFLDAWHDSGNFMLTVTTRENRASHYRPAPIDLKDVDINQDLISLREAIAENAHEVWAAGRMAEGWTYGPQRDDAQKKHPDLLPYSDLPESEKEYDRDTAMNTIKLLVKLGYRLEKKN